MLNNENTLVFFITSKFISQLLTQKMSDIKRVCRIKATSTVNSLCLATVHAFFVVEVGLEGQLRTFDDTSVEGYVLVLNRCFEIVLFCPLSEVDELDVVVWVNKLRRDVNSTLNY